MNEKKTTEIDEQTRALVRGLEAFAYAAGIDQARFDAALSEVLAERFLRGAKTLGEHLAGLAKAEKVAEAPSRPVEPSTASNDETLGDVTSGPGEPAEGAPSWHVIGFCYEQGIVGGWNGGWYVTVNGARVAVGEHECAVLDGIVALPAFRAR